MRSRIVLALPIAVLVTACEEPKPEAKPAASAQAAPAPTPTATEEEKPVKPRPVRDAKLDTKLTDDRRSKIEEKWADAKGFVLAADLEGQVHEKKLEEEGPALKAFDAVAKGKWVLFVGNMNNMTDKGFDMAVTYTPKAEGDPFGMSRKWFYVTVDEVEGFDKSKFKDGERGVVLAKYTGNKKASPAYEVIELELW